MATAIAARWRGYGQPGFPAPSWTVEDTVLRAVAGTQRIDLISRERYADCCISLEYRLPPGGNSGILYRVSEIGAESWQSGPEMQLLDDAGHPDAADPRTSCGALYALLAPTGKPTLVGGAYTPARVVIRATRVEHWLAGVRVLDCDLADESLQALIRASKFAEFPRFARESQGHVVLQHHGTDAWFRNVRIEPL